MQIADNVSLADYSTMGLGGRAAHLTTVSQREEVRTALAWAQARQLPLLMIGGGSNIIWRDEGFAGLVVVNQIIGYTARQESTDTYLTIAAGENWDSVVERSVNAGLTGIEALSLIPGTAGATPIQNVGAYGQEISQTLTSLEALDTQTAEFVTIANTDCGFSYRYSRFKAEDRGRYLILSLTLRLASGNPQPPFYGAVQTYFDEHNITDYTAATLREAVMAIRSSKLPDPAVVHNSGSFFANPIVSLDKLADLQHNYNQVPHWPAAEGQVKLSAAWLIEQIGFKGHHDTETGMATWPHQPLVLVNEHARSTADLIAFRNKIISAVQAKFDIKLLQEPEMLGQR